MFSKCGSVNKSAENIPDSNMLNLTNYGGIFHNLHEKINRLLPESIDYNHAAQSAVWIRLLA